MKRLATLIIVAALFGCAPRLTTPSFDPSSPEDKIAGQILRTALENNVVWVEKIKGGNFQKEYYRPDGNFIVRFGSLRKNQNTGALEREFTGTWRIEGGALCHRIPALPHDDCSNIYSHKGGILYTTVRSREVYAFSTLIEPKKEILTTLEPKGAAGAKTPKFAITEPPPKATPTPPPPEVAATPAPPTPAPRPSATPQPPKTLRLAASGSGFIVSNQTYVLTNDHVIEGCVEVTVRIDDRDIRADIRARDKRNDLALLRLPAGKYPTVAFRGNDGLYPGDSVVAIGYPLNDVLASEGNVSVGIVSALAGMRNDASRLQISAPVQPGNSGGPLFDSSGNVVGVIVSALGNLESDKFVMQNVNFAIKSTVAMLFMQASGVDYKTLKSTKELRTSDVARKGRPATVFIKCWR